MTTDQDLLRDRCYQAAAELCLAMGLRHGIHQIAEAMTEAGMAEAIDIREHALRNARQTDMLEGVGCG